MNRPRRSENGQRFHLTYSDTSGIEKTVVQSDGFEMQTRIRDVEFDCSDLDGIEPLVGQPKEKLSRFNIFKRQLCDCSIEIEIPIIIMVVGEEYNDNLTIKMELGPPDEKQVWLTHRTYSVSCNLEGRRLYSTKAGSIEGALLGLMKVLPDDFKLKCCFSCAFSDYSPGGNSEFGTMMCFRNIKEKYSKVKGKDILNIHSQADCGVQETDCCAEWQLRKPGTGYRG